MRRAARVDENQRDVVAALRKIGAFVSYLPVGFGVPDLLVGYKGQTFLMEVKNKDGRNRMTQGQIEFHNRWIGGALFIVRTPEAAIKAVTQP